MAVNYLTGNESPTAAKMNELWTEADSIIDKALDGKSIYLANPNAISAPSDPLIKGKEFYFYTSGNHDSTDLSVLYAVKQPLPATYNSTTYETAANNATLTYYDSTNKYATTSADIGLNDSLKAHTRTHNGVEYYLWDKGQPHPEKKWRFCTAELLIGDAASDGSGGYKFEFENFNNKYNCFKIHNLTANDITFYFGSSASNNYNLTIPKYSQKCVRRDSVTSGYDSTYKYFFKCNVNDPRYLYFKSHSGFVADTMRANNITNASFLYNILENVGQRKDSSDSLSTHKAPTRITFDAHTYTDIGTEYYNAGYVPEITNSTKVGDLVFHKGDISYMRAATSSSTPEYGTINFNGFDSVVSAFSAAGLTLDIDDGTSGTLFEKAKITKSTTYDYFYLWQKSTNLLTYNDEPKVLNVGDSTGADVYLQTGIGEPCKAGNATNPTVSNGFFGISVFDELNSGIKSVSDYISEYNTSLGSYATSSGTEIKLTTEGPVLFSVEDWKIATVLTPTNPTINFNGFNKNHSFDVYIDSSNDAQIKLKQDRALAYTDQGSKETGRGWPIARNNITDYHRQFEGPKHDKKYQNRGSAYTHLDINNDPVGLSGADFTQNGIGSIVNSGIAFQSCNLNTKIEPFSINLTDNRSYPLTLPGDVSHELEKKKTSSASRTSFISAISGDDTLYIRPNLLKEHYNDLVTMLKKCTQIRPLCFDEIYLGNKKPEPATANLLALSSFLWNAVPKDAYASFVSGSAYHNFWSSLGVTIKGAGGFSDFPDDIYTHATDADKAVMADFRWVTIADVKAKAAAMGFKFRYEEHFQIIDFNRETIYFSGDANAQFDTFRQGTTGNWKRPIFKAVLSGSGYINTLTEGVTYVNSANTWASTNSDGTAAYRTRYVGHTTHANPAILIYLHDTSRTNTSIKGKFAEKQVDSSGQVGSDVIRNLTADEQTITPTSSSAQYLYFCQVTPPVTHSA